ncbi:MAG: hypothetical protein ACPLY7_01890, partial [Microgenomates group bacterium]
MVVITCQIASWDKPIEVDRLAGGKSLKLDEFKIGDLVIIKTEQGTDLARIIEIEDRLAEISDFKKPEPSQVNLHILIRKA